MDPIAAMQAQIAIMQSQIAATQTNIEWLTRIVWGIIVLNGGSFLMNSFLTATVIRNNKNKRNGN